MTDLLFAVAATVASMALMYVVCLRPMRRGRGNRMSRAGPTVAQREELCRLRRDIDALKAAGSASHAAPGTRDEHEPTGAHRPAPQQR